MTRHSYLSLVGFLSLAIYPTARGSSLDPVVESFAAFPSESIQLQQPQANRLPQQTLTSFGFFEGLACGPSISTNSMSCFDLKNRALLGTFSTPGNISTTAVFIDGTIIYGTNEGFLVRQTILKPNGEPQNAFGSLWGDQARQDMALLKPKSSEDLQSSAPVDVINRLKEHGLVWYYGGSSDFVGTPVIQGKILFVMDSIQTLHAFDWQTGKQIWTARISADTSLRLKNFSLSATGKEILVGADNGTILGLEFATGKPLWRIALSSEGSSNNRFLNVAARPYVDDRSIIVSTADGTTERIAMDSQKVEWNFNFASVARPVLFKNNLLLGGTKGAVVAVDKKTGEQKWRTQVSSDSSIASIAIPSQSKDSTLVLVATFNGVLTVLDANNGKILHRSLPTGDVVGEFYDVPGVGSCLSFAAPGLRCFVTMNSNMKIQ